MMLVLKRKPNEAFLIEVPGCEPVRVLLVEASSGAARLGIEASKDVLIYREELDPGDVSLRRAVKNRR